MDHLGIGVVYFPIGESLEYFGQGDTAFQAGQGGSETEVHAMTEGDVVVDLAADVVLVGLVEGPLVATGRPGEQQQLRSFRHNPAVKLHVPHHQPSLDR
jgi:hypothetical protein